MFSTCKKIGYQSASILRLWINQYEKNIGHFDVTYRYITGYNQILSNFSFEQKKDRKPKDKTKQIGYRNVFYLNKSVVK